VGSLIFGTDLRIILQPLSSDAGLREQNILRFVQVSKHIAMFIIPAIIIPILLKKEPGAFLMIKNSPCVDDVILVFILAFLLIPVISYTGMLNLKLNLPDWLSGVEKWIRMKEDYAAGLSKLLLRSTGIKDLIISLFILAAIPAFGEEMLFRGVLQQILCKMFRSGHWGIWITAVLFSALHFQFFGFLPRTILGLSFGYLFFWSRNLWLPVIAHFINNGLSVFVSYLAGGKEFNNLSPDQFIVPVISSVLMVMIFYHFRADYRRKVDRKQEEEKINNY
jgi:membrane protease YdiL (CAAX protease family)